jgi:pimeloyl-ACP methyl ester carboxylesterase
VLHSASSSKNSTTVRSQTSLRLARAALQTAFAVSDGLGSSLAERLFTSPRRHPRPQRERTFLATGRPFTIPVQLRSPRWHGATTKVAAWRWGTGPAVLLIHGWEGRGSQLGAVVEPLVAAGLSVVTFDAPGHGDSPGSRLYLTDHADVIADVADAVGPLHATISHSFGSAALLLAGSRAGLDAPLNVAISPNVLIDDAIARFAKLVALDATELDAMVDTLAAHSGVDPSALDLDRLVGRRDGNLLVFHDREDTEVAVRHADRLAAAWPGAQLVITEGLGHRRILRDPDVIAETVAFVRRGAQPFASDLVREVDRCLAGAPD